MASTSVSVGTICKGKGPLGSPGTVMLLVTAFVGTMKKARFVTASMRLGATETELILPLESTVGKLMRVLVLALLIRKAISWPTLAEGARGTVGKPLSAFTSLA